MQKFVLLLFFITVAHSQQVEKLQDYTSIKIARMDHDAVVRLKMEFSYTTTSIIRCNVKWQGSGTLMLKRVHKNRYRLQQQQLKKMHEKLRQKKSTPQKITVTYDCSHREIVLRLIKEPNGVVYDIYIDIQLADTPRKLTIKWPLGRKQFADELQKIEPKGQEGKLLNSIECTQHPNFFTTKYPAGSDVYEKVTTNKKWKIEIHDKTNIKPEKPVVVIISH